VGVSIDVIGRWERNVNIPNSENIDRLSEALHFPRLEMLAAAGSLPEASYSVDDFIWGYKHFDSMEDFSGALGEIMEETPEPDVAGNDYGSDKKWPQFMELFPEMGRVVAKDAVPIGYWWCLPINEDVYADARLGKNINKSISGDDLERLIVQGKYHLYFVDLFTKKHAREAAKKRLLFSFARFIEDKASQGFLFHKIVANVSTPEARILCRAVGFVKVCDHLEHKMYDTDKKEVPTEVWELVPNSRKNQKFFKLAPNAQNHYRTAGL
jgi:hypothetical protein